MTCIRRIIYSVDCTDALKTRLPSVRIPGGVRLLLPSRDRRLVALELRIVDIRASPSI